MPSRYILISPCRNEAEYMRQTLDSVIAQSVLPAKWVIVDDGSTDATPEILTEYTTKHDWIHVVRRDDRGARSVGPGVIEAFYAGYETIDEGEYDYLCKLDLDLRLPEKYFEILISKMERDPKLGTCSGKAYMEMHDGTLVSERIGDEMSVGASKFYRKDCFQDIGGFERQVMWDGIDCHKCRMKGWVACSWDEVELQFVHLRPMGASQDNILVGRVRWGYGQYFMGTGSLYMLATASYRMTRQPYIVGGLAMIWGYFRSALQREERFDDPAFRAFLRSYQWRALLFGKKKAVEMVSRQK